MIKSNKSIHYNPSNINNNFTPKKVKVILDSPSSKEAKDFSRLINDNFKEVEQRSKSCYKTPYISKNGDISYSKMEMPVSYQLTNGKCVRLRNSQKEYYGINLEDELNKSNLNNIDSNSNSSNTSQIFDSYILKKEKKSLSKDNNSLADYGKNKCVYSF